MREGEREMDGWRETETHTETGTDKHRDSQTKRHAIFNEFLLLQPNARL